MGEHYKQVQRTVSEFFSKEMSDLQVTDAMLQKPTVRLLDSLRV